MQQNTWHIRLLFTLGILALAAYLFYPSLVYFRLSDAELAEVQKDTAAFKKYLPKWSQDSHIVPGLDLQGGVHMVLGVDLDKAISDKARRIAARMRDELTEKHVEFESVDHLADDDEHRDRDRH